MVKPVVDPATIAVVVALSAIAFLILVNTIRKTIGRSEWDAASLLGALSVMLFSSVYIILTYTGTWVVTNKQNQDFWLVPRWGRYTISVISVVLVVISAVVCLRALRRDRSFKALHPGALVALALIVTSCLSTVINGDNPFQPATAVLIVVLAACTVAPRGPGIHVGIGACCVIVAVTSGFAMAVHKDFSVVPCVGDKCGILGFNFRGIFHHENACAIFLALAMPFVFVAFPSWEGAVLSAYLLGLILLTGSRTASAAGILTLVVLILVRPNVRRPAWAPWRTLLVYLLLGLAFVVGLVVPFVINDPGFLDSRGHIWILARDQLSHPATLFLGTGMLGWHHVRDAGLIHFSMGYSAHNQWLHVLYTTGLIGFLLFVGVLALLIWQAGRIYSLVIGCVLLPVFLLAVTELPWPTDSVDWVMWVVPGALLSYPAARRLSGDQVAGSPDFSENRAGRSATGGRHRADT